MRLDLPNKDDAKIKLKYFGGRKQMVKYIVYADFECFIQPSPQSSYTVTESWHVPFAAACQFSSQNDYDASRLEVYKDDCLICYQQLTQNDRNVRDQCHFSSVFRGLAHKECNFNFNTLRFIPIVFHNMSSYDGKLIIRKLTAIEEHIKLLSISHETHRAIYKNILDGVCLNIIVSYRFMRSSLDTLARTTNDDDFVFGRWKTTIYSTQRSIIYDYLKKRWHIWRAKSSIAR